MCPQISPYLSQGNVPRFNLTSQPPYNIPPSLCFRLRFLPTTTISKGDSTIFFDVELTRLKKKSVLEKSVAALQFFIFPLTTSLVIFYLWNKMNATDKSASSPQQQGSGKRSRRNRKRG
eukprot:sb/3476287/